MSKASSSYEATFTSQPSRARTPLLALLALVSAGCSFTMPTAPSDPSERTLGAARRCTTSVWPPVADTISAGVGGVNIAIASSASRVTWYGIEMEQGTAIGLGVAQLAVFGAAATYGYVQAARCKALRDEVATKETPSESVSDGDD